MRTTRGRAPLILGALLSTVLLSAGCGIEDDRERTTGVGADRAPAAVSSVDEVLAKHQLDGLEPVALIDRLDRLAGAARPRELMASVRPDRLVLTAGEEERSLELPADRFYLSVAPYVNSTHECFNHSLTTCTGELSGAKVGVKVVDRKSGKVLVDEERATFANGFVGIWLPRDIEARLTITSAQGRGSVDVGTGVDAATCLTTLRLT